MLSTKLQYITILHKNTSEYITIVSLIILTSTPAPQKNKLISNSVHFSKSSNIGTIIVYREQMQVDHHKSNTLHTSMLVWLKSATKNTASKQISSCRINS